MPKSGNCAIGVEVNFYGPHYARIGGELAAEIRREVFGYDIGQESWRSSEEQSEIVALLNLREDTHVLDVGCGAGGPSLALVDHSGCRLVGLDIEPEGIVHANALAVQRNLGDRVAFSDQDCDATLPFEDGTFDAVLCVDAISHLRNRFEVVADWSRLLCEGGRLLFTDPLVLTGVVSKTEIDGRSALGSNLFFVAPGVNEQAIRDAGLKLVRKIDRADAVAEIALHWHDARARRAVLLKRDEGEEWFARRQLMLRTSANLAASRRLSRFLYVGEKQLAASGIDPF